jgi:PGF-pre-PGF domain-containing protein
MEGLDINRMKFLLLAFLIFTLSSCVGTAAEIHVQPGGSIQAAVNSAHSGDTIIVQPGTYVGNIDISRGYADELNNLILMSASGNPADTAIVADNSAATAVDVISIKYKTNVTVKGFTISEARPNMAGISLYQGKKCTVENNVFLNNGIGVKLQGPSCTDNVIRNNNVDRTNAVGTGTGINIGESDNTKVSKNSVSNYKDGIRVTGSNSRGSRISENSINQNVNSGILLEKARGVTLEGNNVNLNRIVGIYLSESNENNLINNNVLMINSTVDNTLTNGITLYNSDSNTVSNNYASKSDHGIFLNTCKNNLLQNNKVPNNLYGIAMRYSHNNRVINNNADGNKWGIYLTWEDSGNTISGNSANMCIDAGIYLTSLCGEKNLVDNNTVNSNTYSGIYLETHNNIISNNYATGNLRGIFLLGPGCYENTLSNNVVNFSTGNGIRLVNTSNDNKLVSNNINSNSGDGIYLFNSNNSYLDSNNAQGNNIGIHVENSSWSTIYNNKAPYNRIGIRLYVSDNNTVSKNTVSYNSVSGIDLNNAVRNNVTGNTIDSNERGISMCPRCVNNLIYNNYFNNPVNADVNNAANTWNIAKTNGKNIMSGPYTGGNFWAQPGGDGFSQTARDADGDGIADTGYTSTDGNVVDRYPLIKVILPVADFSMSPMQGIAPLAVQFTDLSQNAASRSWDFGDGTNSTEQNPVHTYSTAGNYIAKLTVSNKNDTVSKVATISVQEYKVLPVADFSANPTSGYAPLPVQFTDASQNAASRSWDFNSDGIADSSEVSPAYTYNAPGTYTASLTVSNANGTASKTTQINVLQVTSSNSGSSGSSGSSGGSGGGGAGGSPEPAKNVEVKELSQAFITSGNHAKFDFPRNATSVVSVSFDSKKTAGKTTTITEMLKEKSTLVSGLPSGEVYKSLNIWVGNSGFATPKNIENAVVCFKVEKSWIQDKKIDKSSITLNRYSDKKWNELPTSLLSEDGKYLYFTAQTPGFSPFAITGKTTATGTEIQPVTGTKTQPPVVNETQTKPNTGNTAANVEQTPEQKESKSMPGFEIVCGITALLAVFLYRRK